MSAEMTASWEQVAETPVERSRWLVLAVVLAGAFMILLDSTIVNVAIPSIQIDLGASYAAIEWVISGYALTSTPLAAHPAYLDTHPLLVPVSYETGSHNAAAC